MTYNGLKSLLLAGVARDDARVEAAVAWIRNHYNMTSNPGMGEAGLYHYYHVLRGNAEYPRHGRDRRCSRGQAQLARRTLHRNRSSAE